jgi:hypothetical protein
MNYSIRTQTSRTSTKARNYAIAALASVSFLFSGCFRGESSGTGDASGDATATIEGRVQGDAELGGMGKRSSSSAGVEAATVTVMRIKADGSLEAVSAAEVKTDAQGRFSVKAAVNSSVEGTRELVVSAKKTGREWKAVVSGKVKQGSTVVCRPLTIESSVEADVLAKVRAQSGSSEVSFADIASHIDAGLSAKVDASADVNANGNADEKAAAETWLAAQIATEAKANSSALVASAGKFTLAQIDKANEARLDAQAKLEADLDAAIALEGAVSTEAKARIESNRQEAEFKAWIGAGIALGELAKAREISYQAAVHAGTEVAIEAGTKLAWMRKLALDNAVTLEAAVKEDVKASGNQSDIAVTSGTVLKASLGAASTEAEIAIAFAAFRASVAAGLKTFMETHLTGKVEGNVSGAAVQVATIKADGSLEILPNVTATTDAQGGFTLNSDTKLPDSLVVLVTKNEAKLMILVDSATSKPVQVGAETTLEARLAQAVLKGGTSIVTQAEINAQVDSGVAAQVNGNDSATARLMAALEVAARAKAGFLADAGATVAASAEGKARSLQVYAQALARLTVGLSTEARMSVVKSAHVQAGLALSAAAEAQVKAAGALEATLKSVQVAGSALHASLQAAVSEEAIASAYASYHASVIAGLKAAVLLHGATVESLDAKIRAQDGARAELMAKIQGAVDAAAAAKAHTEFSASVEAQVSAAFTGGLGSPSEAHVKAIAQALILANMGG